MPRRLTVSIGLALIAIVVTLRCAGSDVRSRPWLQGLASARNPRPVEPSSKQSPEPPSGAPPSQRLVLVAPGVPVDAPEPTRPASSDDLPRVSVRLTRDLVRARDYAGARAEIERGIAADDRNPEAFYWRSVATASVGNKPSALFDAEHAVAMAPGFSAARTYAGALALDLGRPDDAIRNLSEVIARDPGHGRGIPRRLRALARMEKGDTPAAMVDARAACDGGNQDGCRLREVLGGPRGDRFRILSWYEVP